jgi:hypothetical protein
VALATDKSCHNRAAQSFSPEMQRGDGMLFVRNPELLCITTLNQGVPGWRMPKRLPPPRPMPRT